MCSMEATSRLRPQRGWFSFSLRTLLLGLTIFAIWLGWWVNSARQQRQAAAAIRQLGGGVYYDFQVDKDGTPVPDAVSWVPSAVIRILGEDLFHNVVLVNMIYNGDGPGRQFNQQLTDTCLDHLGGFRNLQHLYLWGDQASDAGLAKVGRALSLRTLDMREASGITDAGIAQLGGLRNLQSLLVGGSQIGNESLRILSTLPRLTQLLVPETSQFTDEGLAHVARMRQLESLWLSFEAGGIIDKRVGNPSGPPNLTEVELRGTRVAVEGLAQLQGLPNLMEIAVQGDGESVVRTVLLNRALP
jgi:hypothetical protein